jgi:phage-related baseplate assembly protein
MSTIQDLLNMPDVNFVDTNVETMLSEMVSTYEQAYYAQTGVSKTLAAGDPIRILLYCQALREYARLQSIDNSAKQNLLKYAEDVYLINKGADVDVVPPKATAATVTQRFNLSAAQSQVVTITAGIRVGTPSGVFFEVLSDVDIAAGQTRIDLTVQCTETGTVGNNFIPGQINVLVDPVPYIASTTNIDTSQGGNDGFIIGDFTSNENLREEIFLKPESFSVAGPSGAYKYFARYYNPLILDVAVTSPSDGVVDIRFIMGVYEYDSSGNLVLTDVQLPQQSMIDGLLAHISADKKRPLTDHVTGGAPSKVTYNIGVTYYIRTGDSENAANIQTAVNKAVTVYKLWQKSKIGRDIDPGELDSCIRFAGAKRSVITSPVFTTVDDVSLAWDGTVSVTYGGLEDE